MTEAAHNLDSNPCVEEVKGNSRVEDKLRLRELEVQTQYELKYLSDGLRDLRGYVELKLNNESDKFEALNKKVNWVIYFILAQMAGLNAESVAPILKGFIVP